MLLICWALILGIVSMVSGAALSPTREAISPHAQPSSACAPASIPTVYVHTTVYSPPETITIAVENYTSVFESLSSAASVDTAQVSNGNEFEPISESIPTAASTFVHTIVVPIVEATVASNSTSGVYYVSIGQNTTVWSYTPTQSTVVGTTTVIVSPFPTAHGSSANSTETTSSTTRITRTVTPSNSDFPLTTGGIFTGPKTSAAPPYPLTNGANNSTLFGATLGTGEHSVSHHYSSTVTKYTTVASTTVYVLPNNSTLSTRASESVKPSVHYNATVTEYTIVATTTSYVISYPNTMEVNGTQTVNLTSSPTESVIGYSGTNATSSYGKRQVCTLVYASISGNLASWCNNWDGHTVFHHSTYTSTLTPPQYATEASASTNSSPSTSATGPTLEVSAVTSSEVLTTTVTISPSGTPAGMSTSGLTPPASSISSAPPAATSCGQQGLFEINFDNLPVYSPTNNETGGFPEIFNPYSHFFWGSGWTYGPPPSEPFPAQSGDCLAEFVPSLANNSTNSPDAGTVPDNAFGAGPRAGNSDYWFNAESVYVGCDNGATDPSDTCDFVATGYQWDLVNLQETVVATEHFPQEPCSGFKDCNLNQIFFDSRFEMLSSLSFYANVQGQQKIFWIDTMELSWYNNTCEAGLARISSQ